MSEKNMWQIEQELHAQGIGLICGVDEAGRGPLAGPVCAAAVILPDGLEIPGLDDSKKLTDKRRRDLYPLIQEHAIASGIGFAQRYTAGGGYVEHRRNRHRQLAVLTTHRPLPFGERFNHTTGNIQIIRQHRRSNNISNGVNCADFVKMHFFYRTTVGFGFGFGHNTESFFRKFPRPFSQIAPGNDRQNVRQITVNVGVVMFVMMMVFVTAAVTVMVVTMPVLVMFVVVVVGVVVVVMTMHVECITGYAVGFSTLDVTMHLFAKLQTIQRGQQFFLTAAQIQQRRHGHISGDPGSTFQIEHLTHKPINLSHLTHTERLRRTSILPPKPCVARPVPTASAPSPEWQSNLKQSPSPAK